MDLETARALAYAHLNRRERTVQEVRQHLIARGADDQRASSVLQELTDLGYLDDARFARLFAQDKRNLSGWGTGRIRRALAERGITDEVVEAALESAGADADGQPDAEGATHADELERALTVLRRRFPQPPATSRDRGRALGVLMRKGYDYELAVDALAAHVRQGRDAIAPSGPQY